MLASPLIRRPGVTLLEWVVRGLARAETALHREGGDAAGTRTKAAGNAGEREAYFYLRRLGYTVVARGWRAPNVNGEIDLIAWDGETLCFVEVKTRTAEDRFTAAYAVDASKRKTVRRMARAYVQGLPWRADEPADPETRFDLISVYLQEKPVRLEHDRGMEW